MDRKPQSEHSSETKTGKRRVGLIATLGCLAVIALAAGFFFSKRGGHGVDPHAAHGAHGEEHAHEGGHGDGHGATGIVQTYVQAFASVQAKIDGIRRLETENERLRLENAHLRLKLEGQRFERQAGHASEKTRKAEYKMDRETGSVVGRDLASIPYHVPSDLMPAQLYTLGISYFKAREDEKAAVIFTFLTGLEDNDSFKGPKNLLMTGVAWYRLENFTLAERYFDRVLRAAPAADNEASQAQARLWKALAALRTQKSAKTQFWLTELLDHHPHSTEAGWVNSKAGSKDPHHRTEAHRGVASED